MTLQIPVTIHTTPGHVFADAIVKEFHEEFIIIETPEKDVVTIYYEGIDHIAESIKPREDHTR